MTISDEPVVVDLDGAVATVTLNRPDRLNALGPEAIDLLAETLERVSADATVRVVQLTGAGVGFSAGGDLTDGPAALLAGATAAERAAVFRQQVHVVEILRSMRQVTVAAVNGACAGAGLSLALACDLRVASSDAVFASAFLAAGVSGDLGGIWLATRLLGAARARELFLLGGRLDAAEALRIGLVSRVHPAEVFRTEVAELTSSLAAAAPLGLAGMVANLRDAEELSLADYLDLETERQERTMTSADAAEAAAAFFAKRSPVFTGR